MRTGSKEERVDERELQNASDQESEPATEKPDGLGRDGTIPSHPDGIAAGHTGEKSNFEPEEDEDA